MDDFTKEYLKGIIVINVNISCATLKEATEFERIIDEEMIYNRKQLILDLSQCEFIDSIFLGCILYQHNRMFEEKGTLSVVSPKKLWGDLWLVSKVLEKLNLYKTRDEAIESLNQNSLPSIGEVFH